MAEAQGGSLVALINSRESYGWLTIALHWIAGLGVIAMVTTGLEAQFAHDRAAHSALMGLHVATGATLFVFFAARIALHYAQPRPEKPSQAGWLNIAAAVSQNLLLIGLLIQIISGPLAVWSGAHAINVFDIVKLPSPFAARNKELHEACELAHLIGRVIIFVVLPVHVLGALKHLVFDRDGAFTRMLWPSRLKKSA
jgi:cytochrome b561